MYRLPGVTEEMAVSFATRIILNSQYLSKIVRGYSTIE